MSFRISDNGAARNINNNISAIPACFPGSLPMDTANGYILFFIFKIEKGGQLGVGSQPYMAATSAITTIRPPFGHKLLPAKTHTAITAVTGLNKNRRTIDKLHSPTCLLNNLSLYLPLVTIM